MVIYDLICSGQHEFEGWFNNVEDFNEQKRSGLLQCPVCNSLDVKKKLAAPKLARKSNSVSLTTAEGGQGSKPALSNASRDAISPDAYKQLQKQLGKLHKHIDRNFSDVGNRFADEALSMSRGEKEPENIKGTATKEQLQELREEGVAALPVPPKPVDKDKLN